MDFCETLNSAKCCAANMADAYVAAVSVGEDTDDKFYTLMLLNGYIRTLERYNHNPTAIKITQFANDGVFLSDNGKILSLACTSEKVCLDPDHVNCLKRSDICFILEQVSLLCENCSCDC
jgi:hypothetical protein